MIHDPKELSRIGQLIRSGRNGRSQSWLAEKVETTSSVISNIERGKRLVPKRKVGKFAQILGLKEKELLPSNLINTAELRSEIDQLEHEMGVQFRDLVTLPDEAKKELLAHFKQLKERHEKGLEIAVDKMTPEEVALNVLRKCKIENETPIDLNKIAKIHNISIEESSTIDAVGWILYPLEHNQKWAAIKYKKDLGLGRKRFTIAHELGHFFLGNLDRAEKSCSIDGQNKGNERDADKFASELLMPEKLVKEKVGNKIRGIENVLEISQAFEVSLTAAAIRLVRMSDIPSAVIYSEGGKIKWGYTSPAFYLRVKSGQSLSRHSSAYKMTKKDGLSKIVNTKCVRWMYGNMQGTFKEHSICTYKKTKSVLTLIWKA